MHCFLGQHACLEEFHISIGIPWHHSIFGCGRFIVLRLPIAKDLQRLILDDAACELQEEMVLHMTIEKTSNNSPT